MNIEKLIKKVDRYAKKHLSEKRYGHSVRVAMMCSEIAELCGYDSRKAYLCGICHDICKEIPKPKMIVLAEKGGFSVTDYEKTNPSLLHGKAASFLMKKKFHIKDEDLLGAVAYHVSGTNSFSPLGKIIFIADKNERGRSHVNDEFVADLYSMKIDDMFLFAEKKNYEYIRKKTNFVLFDDACKVLSELGISYEKD